MHPFAPRAAPTRTLVPALARLAVGCALVVGCGQSPPPQVTIADWCMRMETAIRDRALRCECPGETLGDAAIEARCATLGAGSLIAAFDADEVGWHGSIAGARVAAIDDCDTDPAAELLLDDPVIGGVEVGQACRVFEDVWGRPDDCAYGALCAAPLDGEVARCVAMTNGPPPSGTGCARAVCSARGEPCDAPSDCDEGVCREGVCAAPVCAIP